jgi:hypothetical protein
VQQPRFVGTRVQALLKGGVRNLVGRGPSRRMLITQFATQQQAGGRSSSSPISPAAALAAASPQQQLSPTGIAAPIQAWSLSPASPPMRPPGGAPPSVAAAAAAHLVVCRP